MEDSTHRISELGLERSIRRHGLLSASESIADSQSGPQPGCHGRTVNPGADPDSITKHQHTDHLDGCRIKSGMT